MIYGHCFHSYIFVWLSNRNSILPQNERYDLSESWLVHISNVCPFHEIQESLLDIPKGGPSWQSQPSILVIIPNGPLVLTFADKRWHASLILSLKWKTTFGLLKCFLLSLNEIYHHPFQNCYLHNFFFKTKANFQNL